VRDVVGVSRQYIAWLPNKGHSVVDVTSTRTWRTTRLEVSVPRGSSFPVGISGDASLAPTGPYVALIIASPALTRAVHRETDTTGSCCTRGVSGFGTLHIYDVLSHKQVLSRRLQTYSTTSLTWSPDDSFIVLESSPSVVTVVPTWSSSAHVRRLFTSAPVSSVDRQNGFVLANPSRPRGPRIRWPYPALTGRLIEAFTQEYADASPAYSMSIISARVPARMRAAARRVVETVIRDCNEGTRTSLVGVGIVRSNLAHGRIWAVYVDPPGRHEAPHAGPDQSHEGPGTILNWYAGFVTGSSRPFCTFGRSPTLPPLPRHR
jgi:hypothetical protein